MRILFLCTDAYGGHGGIALFNRDSIEAIAAHPRCEEVVVLPRLAAADIGTIPHKVTFLADAATSNMSYSREVARLLRERARFDAVLCGHMNLLPVASAMTNKPLLVIYGIEAWKPPRALLARRLAPAAGAVISISEITLRRFMKWSRFAGRTSILPNAIHLEAYGVRPRNVALSQRFGLDGKRVIMTLGRLMGSERYKGFDEVLEVLPELTGRVSNLVYVIAGDGDDRPRLEAIVRNRDLGDHVTFTGFVAENEKPALYSLADVYAMPSRGEGFGFVLLEAMACGVPVIASKHDGGREAVAHGRLGSLVDPSNPAELKEAILAALDDRERSVPDGLDYFSFSNFQSRVHALVDEFVPAAV